MWLGVKALERRAKGKLYVVGFQMNFPVVST